MKTYTKFLLVPALALIAGLGLWAQSAAPATKIAVVNMQEAIANTKQGQARIAELQKKYAPKDQEFQKRATDIQAKQEQFRKTQNTMSEEAKAEADAEIKRLATELQRDEEDTQQDSEADQQKLLQDVGSAVMKVVEKYAQENQIMIVFDLSSQTSNLICCSSAPDITREIVAAYDKAAPAGTAPTSAATKPAAPARPAATAPAPGAAKPTAPAKPPATPAK